ncbi:hypothetical protein LX36DRAFT_391710 [Colletotrichum falcatum]|nr:hypothetical protein LX36DRAFT_391710 [Colletotrichum falcatum]
MCRYRYFCVCVCAVYMSVCLCVRACACGCQYVSVARCPSWMTSESREQCHLFIQIRCQGCQNSWAGPCRRFGTATAEVIRAPHRSPIRC